MHCHRNTRHVKKDVTRVAVISFSQLYHAEIVLKVDETHVSWTVYETQDS